MDDIYRPWAYANQINDYGVADSSVSFFGTITAIFFCYSLEKNLDYNFKFLVMDGLGCIIYEILQPYFELGIFDIKDIVAIFLGVFVTHYICIFLRRTSTFRELRA